ncbi:hypothetical protein LEP1GSC047_3161 [Leptospira inadai serovar Lyme str. 10]|uniref:Uncharacterized protein n=1 Tax=Leptospira inadai serovar Lyme str. 10 TaxID=1049790 RepID=V6HAY1_9LEPT|nr:hypothetical protein LEP1GSC047_3161 [Leptospira inadai serovar Lyme str. 10]
MASYFFSQTIRMKFAQNFLPLLIVTADEIHIWSKFLAIHADPWRFALSSPKRVQRVKYSK